MINVKGLGQRQKPRTGDYYDKEGILVCGICGKQREWSGYWPGVGMTWAACSCECDMKKYPNYYRNKENWERKYAETLRERAFSSNEEYAKARFSIDDRKNEKVTEAAFKYANNLKKMYSEGKNLLIFGNVGTGKSFMAAAVLNEAIDQNYKCLFTTFSREINEITKSKDKTEYLQNLKSYDFVVFDDFGAEKESEYNLEQIYKIVNARYVAGKPMIITTNLSKTALTNPEGLDMQRIISRIVEKVVPILCDGDDRRMKKIKR